MNLSPVLFWDCNKSSIDWEKNARYVIARVVMYGTLNDWRAIRNHYGLERIKMEMLQERELDVGTLSFLSTIFEIPKEKFKCYSERHCLQGHWIY